MKRVYEVLDVSHIQKPVIVMIKKEQQKEWSCITVPEICVCCIPYSVESMYHWKFTQLFFNLCLYNNFDFSSLLKFNFENCNFKYFFDIDEAVVVPPLPQYGQTLEFKVDKDSGRYLMELYLDTTK